MSDSPELIHERLDAVDVPPPDLAGRPAGRQGYRIRGRRAVVGASEATAAGGRGRGVGARRWWRE